MIYHVSTMIALLAAAATANAQPKAASASPACQQLSRQVIALEKEMAVADIDGLLDNSAPRAQLRAQENTNRLLQAKIALDLMAARSCPLPAQAPSSSSYFAAALACKNDTMKGVKNAPSCNKDSWTAVSQN